MDYKRHVEEQIDDEDSDDEKSNHPALGDIPDNSQCLVIHL